MEYEGGCNRGKGSYSTGLGWKRQGDIVSQWHLNDARHSLTLPPSGLPIGNVQSTFGYLWMLYGSELEELCFLQDGASTPYAFYDRWGDSWKITAEMVILNSARSLASLSFLAAQTPLKTQPWTAVPGQITAPTGIVPVGSPVTLSLQANGVDLTGSHGVWEARDLRPPFGSTLILS